MMRSRPCERDRQLRTAEPLPEPPAPGGTPERALRPLGAAKLARLLEIGRELRSLDSADSLLARALDAALEELRAERGVALLVPEGARWTGDAAGAALL
ncbi:MAG: hypothetical protein ACUVYA_15125, partial [Planctomycetota bacterium]